MTDEKQQAANNYATTAKFCGIFEEDMQSLYLLAFLLTANHEHAEQCFCAAMEDGLNEHSVFKEWARSWSRRIVIKNAIRLFATSLSAHSPRQPDRWAEAGVELAVCTTINSVTQLASFDRVVFVLTVLERYSARECALLLDCSVRDVQGARMRALQQLPALYLRTAADAEDFPPRYQSLQREYERSRP